MMKKTTISMVCVSVLLVCSPAFAGTRTTHVVGFEEYASQLGENHAWNSTPDRTHSGNFPDGMLIEDSNESANAYHFNSGGLSFSHSHQLDGFYSWEGTGLSTVTDTTNPGFMNDMASATGNGADGSSTYGVVYSNNGWSGKHPTISLPIDPNLDAEIVGMMINTTAYLFESMVKGDEFTSPLSGAVGKYMDLIVYGYDAEGNLLENTVSTHLGYNDGGTVEVVDDWTWLNLTALAGAKTLEFRFDSNEKSGEWLNYPTYFAIDDITYTTKNADATTPEPATLLLCGIGALGWAARSFRRKRS